MKPHLPDEIRLTLPCEIVHHIYSFLPHMEKETPKTVSPSLQKELKRIQNMRLRGKSSTYMKDFEDFCLD
jgi:hypothetical protein